MRQSGVDDSFSGNEFEASECFDPKEEERER